MNPIEEKNNFQDFQDFAERENISAAQRETCSFAREHRDEDTARLLLSAARYPSIDMPAAVQQIEGLRTAREKWPSLAECAEYLYPPRLNREQASSEAAALYKSRIISSCSPCGLTKSIDPTVGFLNHAAGGGEISPARYAHEIHRSNEMKPTAGLRIADLTGGMGVDTLAFAKVAEHVDYVERDAQLCAFMEHNLRALGVDNVTVHCADSLQWLAANPSPLSVLYLDPARRDAAGRKVAAFEDCTPDLLANLALLRGSCQRLLVKASPMIDLALACRQLGGVSEVHVVELRGECKEVLFLLGGAAAEDPQIVCVNLNNQSIQNIQKTFTFTRSEEAAAEADLCDAVGSWLYEPGAALMKAGPYRLLAQRYGLLMLGPNTHLYTADRRVDDFPGRVLRVVQEVRGGRKELAALLPDGRAHVVTRNYPAEAATLQRQLGLREGGDHFVVGTTVGRRRTLLLCEQE